MSKVTYRVRKVDTIFLVVSVFCLVFCLAAVGTPGRERARRAVCLSNLRQLTCAWLLYARENDGKLVNGAGGFHYLRAGGQTGDDLNTLIIERAWVGRGWGYNWNNANVADTRLTEEQKSRNIREGALWPLVGDERCYKCPVGRPYEWVNYAIVDAMNGLYRAGTTSSTAGGHPGAVGRRIGRIVLWVKNLDEIDLPTAAERMVFIDEGALTPDSFSAHYQQAFWWDDPPVRHNDGAPMSWADGHASYFQWQAPETIERGRATIDYYGGGGFAPQTPEGIQDLDNLRRAVWGRLPNDPTQ